MTELLTISTVKRDAAGASLLSQIGKDRLTVVLVRHGQPGPGLEVDGLLGKPLTAVGRRQARCVAQRLAQVPLTHIYCSDMARSYQTAQVVHELSPQVPIEVATELREIPSFHQPGGPVIRTQAERRQRREQQEAAERFITQLRSRHGIGDVISIVTHSGINRLLVAILAGLPLKKTIPTGADHAAVTVVSVTECNHVAIRLLNCTRHLPVSLIGTNNL